MEKFDFLSSNLSASFRPSTTSKTNYQEMSLDPTENDDLHAYIWDNLLKRIATESALYVPQSNS